jgi:hypothetical protein
VAADEGNFGVAGIDVPRAGSGHVDLGDGGDWSAHVDAFPS